mgnify:CR=1 FL=1
MKTRLVFILITTAFFILGVAITIALPEFWKPISIVVLVLSILFVIPKLIAQKSSFIIDDGVLTVTRLKSGVFSQSFYPNYDLRFVNGFVYSGDKLLERHWDKITINFIDGRVFELMTSNILSLKSSWKVQDLRLLICQFLDENNTSLAK